MRVATNFSKDKEHIDGLINYILGMPFLTVLLLLLLVNVHANAQADILRTLPPIRIADHLGQKERKTFPRFGQCQIKFDLEPRPDQLQMAKQPVELRQRLGDCFEIARTKGVNVLILPELALSFTEEIRSEVLAEAKKLAKETHMIIIAGSYYDDQRHNRLLVIGEDWIETGFKLRPSRFEVAPKAHEGMNPGESLLVLKTIYGTLAVITCVDLISDEVQFLMRRLATRGEIDVLININYNPQSWEFLIEANSIVRRHPIFASITNVASYEECPVDNGGCAGYTAVFADLRTRLNEAPNNADRISAELPPSFTSIVTEKTPKGPVTRKIRLLPYDHLVATITAFEEAMLIYDLNLNLTREPITTNAPDQGYPTIKNVQKEPLPQRPSVK